LRALIVLPNCARPFFTLPKPIREIDLCLAQHAASMRSFARHELAELKTEFNAQGLELEGVLLGWSTAPGVVSSASSALAARLR
jgi:hypothetical protein